MTSLLKHFRAAVRFTLLIFYLIKGYLIVLFKFPLLSHRLRQQEVQKWSIKVLQCFGIIVHLEGAFTFRGPLLIVSNHISWLDVLVLHSVGYCRFVAKSEIGGWPVVGFLTRKTGMFFIEREKPRSAIKVVQTMSEALQEGSVLAVFPEGTTSDGTDLLPFHANLVQAAVSANAPVQPLCISYLDRASGLQTQAPSFVGEITLVQSVWSTISAAPITAKVKAGELQYCQARSRKEWAVDLRLKIGELLLAFKNT